MNPQTVVPRHQIHCLEPSAISTDQRSLHSQAAIGTRPAVERIPRVFQRPVTGIPDEGTQRYPGSPHFLHPPTRPLGPEILPRPQSRRTLSHKRRRTRLFPRMPPPIWLTRQSPNPASSAKISTINLWRFAVRMLAIVCEVCAVVSFGWAIQCHTCGPKSVVGFIMQVCHWNKHGRFPPKRSGQ
jgi:hypothetical protein